MKPRTFRVRCKVGVKSPVTTPFARFGDSNRWAMDYARHRPCRVTVIDDEGAVLADYVGDGEGRVWCVANIVPLCPM